MGFLAGVRWNILEGPYFTLACDWFKQIQTSTSLVQNSSQFLIQNHLGQFLLNSDLGQLDTLSNVAHLYAGVGLNGS